MRFGGDGKVDTRSSLTNQANRRDMDGAKLFKQAMADQPKGYLEARHAVFVADIQRMPALIAKMFAVMNVKFVLSS